MRPGLISSFELVANSHMTCTGLHLCRRKLRLPQSLMFSLMALTTAVAEASMSLPVFDNGSRCLSWSWMKHCNLALVMESDKSLCSRAMRQPKVLGVPTTLTLYLGHWGPCVPQAVSLMVPWALCGAQDPHALHTVVTLSEKCTAESS